MSRPESTPLQARTLALAAFLLDARTRSRTGSGAAAISRSMRNQEEILVSKTEAARVSGLSLSTIIRLVKRGVLREIVLAEGMHPRIRLEDVLRLSEGSPRT